MAKLASFGLVLFLLCKLSVSKVHHYEPEMAELLFDEFIKDYNKYYESEDEKAIRLEIFRDRLVDINKHNAKAGQNHYGITYFADMTWEEMSKHYLGFKPPHARRGGKKKNWSKGHKVINGSAPDSLDWRSQNVLPPIKDQGACGSCWAFSAISCLESQNAIKHKNLVPLSEEQLVDCIPHACQGNFPHKGYQYLKSSGGSEGEESYPYTASSGEAGDCRFDPSLVKVQISNYDYNQRVSEEDMKNLVASYGPISIAFYVYDSFFSYAGGILQPHASDCPSDENANHAVNIVGYGEEDGVPYWLVRNSWGESWGEDGYFRIIRGQGVCQLGSYVATVEVA